MQFEEYISAALQKHPELKVAVLQNFVKHEKFVQSALKDWEKVVKFYSIRLMLAPLIETSILLDRLLYLRENDSIKATLAPVFDVALSPRNIALIAIKKYK